MKDFMSGFIGQPLDKKQIAAGMHLCYMNARALAEEARLLRENSRYARALSLTILALEELGKIPLIYNMILYKADDAKPWREFWKTFQSHQIKLEVWSTYGKRIMHALGRSYETVLPSGIEPLVDKFKQLGFYVSFFKDQFLFPEEFARDNHEWLDLLTAILNERLISFDPLHGSLENSERFVDQGVELLATVREAKTKDELKKLLSDWISRHGH
jgi:AbiV family abortive infection protein